ncbi:Cytochrome P450 monooxygenase [Cladobotryum mycophilum]|uniref:Cytochrome P450 monooxygenase n=1 Tax=Cladobotryum mycophilum TaxID=491253 RepID=A0ABR0T3Q8_9HYPO
MDNSSLASDVLMDHRGPSTISVQDIWGSLYLIIPALFVVYCTVDTFFTRRLIQAQKHFPVGSWLATAPKFVLNLIFAGQGTQVLQKAYKKYEESGFQLIRNNGRIVVLPLNLLEELASLPEKVANPQAALEHDLLGRYTGLNLILENRLHHSIVQRKLTPRLPLLLPRMEKATADSFAQFFPNSEEWTEFQPYQVLGRISARVAADAIVGPALSNNSEWLDIAFNYTENREPLPKTTFLEDHIDLELICRSVFRTIVVLRTLPEWTHPLVYPVLPSYWACQKYLKMAKTLLGPRIEEKIANSDSGTWVPKDDNTDDTNVLSWLSHMAKGRDRSSDTISHVLVLVALASVHTTLLRMVNVLYDVTAAGPSLLEGLLDEIASVSRNGWNTGSYDELHQLDSVMRESQRMSPPTTLGLKRLFREPYTFQDGTFVPAGTYVCLPIHAIENDADHNPRPEAFDGLRSFHAREEREQAGDMDKLAAKEFLFSSPTRTALNFGYGKSACPGRFFASCVIKMVAVKMFTEYEFKFLPGTERPSNLMVHEFLFTWPWQKILVRRKQQKCPF